MDAVAQGEQEVPLVRKRSRASVPKSALPSWPAPPTNDGFGFLDQEESFEETPPLKRRKTLPKPLPPSHLLKDLLRGRKSVEVSHSAQTIIRNTLAFHKNPSLFDPTIPKFLTPTNLPLTIPKPSAILPEPLSTSTSTPSSPPKLNIPHFLPYLDTDSEDDPEYIPNPPSSPNTPPPSPPPFQPSSSQPFSSHQAAGPSSSQPTGPSTSHQTYRGVPSMPIPIGLENKIDYALEMLNKISRQLQDLHTQQQVGFADLQLRHDTNDINLDAVTGAAETTAVTTNRILLGEVRKIFTRGSPKYQTEEDNAAWRKKLALEVNDARHIAEVAVQGERNMRALNVRLLQEINDLRRQLNQEQYMHVPVDRDIVREHIAEDGINRRIDEAAAREADRHRQEQDRVNNVREAIYMSD